MSQERRSLFPFESNPGHIAGETIVVDTESLFTNLSPESKTPEDHLQNFLREVAFLPDVRGITFSREPNNDMSIETIITTKRNLRGNYYFDQVLAPRVKTALETLKAGLKLKRIRHGFETINPDNLESDIETLRWASNKHGTLLRLVLFK